MDREVKKFNEQSLGEEIANAVSHGVGAALAVAGTVLVIIRAALLSDAMGIVAACLYGASTIILFLFSTLYHSLTPYRAKKVFQIFDHCSIFVLILGTYIAAAFTLLKGPKGWILFGINAACAVVGIVFNSINLDKWRKASLVLYLIMGWSVLMFLPDVIRPLPSAGIAFLVGGGVLYTLGVPFYILKSKKYTHFVWHLFVLGGAVLHWFFVFYFCFPAK